MECFDHDLQNEVQDDDNHIGTWTKISWKIGTRLLCWVSETSNIAKKFTRYCFYLAVGLPRCSNNMLLRVINAITTNYSALQTYPFSTEEIVRSSKRFYNQPLYNRVQRLSGQLTTYPGNDVVSTWRRWISCLRKYVTNLSVIHEMHRLQVLTTSFPG